MPDEGDVLDRLEMARERLEEAGALMRAGFHPQVVHEAYYAAFHAAMALLAREGVQPRTHRGTLAETRRRFVPDGRLHEETVALLERALDARLKSDYSTHTRPSEEEAEQILEAARSFVEAVETLLST